MNNKSSKFSKIKVDYTESWNDDIGVTLFKDSYKMVVRSHTKRYHNCLYLLAGLSSCARDVMDFITEEMDNDNVISTNEYFRDTFIAFIKNTTKGLKEVSYADSTVKRALRDLTAKGLIRQVKRGYSKVNPEFFFKNDDKRRLDMIKVELEFKSNSITQLRVIAERRGDDIQGFEEPKIPYGKNE